MEVAALRLLHLAFGVFWSGGTVLMGFWVIPAIVEAGPAGGPVMKGMVVDRKLPQVLTVSGLLTVLTGLRLYQLRFSTAWLTTPEGLALTLAGLLAIGGLTIGLVVQRPTAGRLAALTGQIAQAGGPPTTEQAQEIAHLRAKLLRTGKILGAHAGAAALLMAGTRLAQVLS